MNVDELVKTHPGPADALRGGSAQRNEPVVISHCQTIDRTLVIALRGVIDETSVYPVRLMLAVAVKSGYVRLVVDCEEVTDCGKELLDLLLSWKRNGRNLVLASPSSPVRRQIAAEIAMHLFLCALSVRHALDLVER
ncbi:STAS domain-containing protein [Streptomyces formicae]|uniref:Anti-sigma factor antagonist n=1 Tax=Streptomyces formicae TaxID=1616117 RepID=A0ABY3WEX3_9ACTN|nr:STAS domain-containing protein [Streptomyces formicae]UNM10245.1 anti-sigma factor antagonist [Streptomyces formicae]